MTQKASTRWRLWICLLNKTSSRVFKKPSAIWAGKVRNTRRMSKERKTVRREVIHRPTDIYPLLFVFILVTHIDPRELFFHTSKASYVGLTRCGEEKGAKNGKRKKRRKGEIKMVKRFFACWDARCMHPINPFLLRRVPEALNLCKIEISSCCWIFNSVTSSFFV